MVEAGSRGKEERMTMVAANDNRLKDELRGYWVLYVVFPGVLVSSAVGSLLCWGLSGLLQ